MRDESGSVATVGDGKARRSQLGRALWPLLILFVALEFVDVVTTNHGLSLAGVREGNPIMSALQRHLGAAWWLPKALAVAWVALSATRIRRRWPLVFAVSFCGLVVAINLVVR